MGCLGFANEELRRDGVARRAVFPWPSDAKVRDVVHAVAGDVFYFPKGSVITFKTKTYGLAFYTGQRAEGGA